MKYLVTTLDADTLLPAAKVGGKAAALYKLRDAGFPVPPGVCLTTEALPVAVENLLVDSLTALEMNEVPVAVRSSAVHEDGTGSSFAGQYATLLGVRGSASIVNAVLDCWRSYFSTPAIAARALHEYAHHEEAMAAQRRHAFIHPLCVFCLLTVKCFPHPVLFAAELLLHHRLLFERSSRCTF